MRYICRNATIIRIGEVDLSVELNNDTDTNMQQIRICRTLIHPLYRSPLLYNDIALLYLEDPVEISPYASPICLPQKFSITETPVALLTGWGQLSFGNYLLLLLFIIFIIYDCCFYESVSVVNRSVK